jgi:hypothetical protein
MHSDISPSPRLQPKSAFSWFPLVHRADLEAQQRLDSDPIVLQASNFAAQSLARGSRLVSSS